MNYSNGILILAGYTVFCLCSSMLSLEPLKIRTGFSDKKSMEMVQRCPTHPSFTSNLPVQSYPRFLKVEYVTLPSMILFGWTLFGGRFCSFSRWGEDQLREKDKKCYILTWWFVNAWDLFDIHKFGIFYFILVSVHNFGLSTNLVYLGLPHQLVVCSLGFVCLVIFLRILPWIYHHFSPSFGDSF